MKSFFHNLSHMAITNMDSEDEITKKLALTLLPLYVSIPAIILGSIYFYTGNISAFYIPLSYIIISALSYAYLYKTKKFRNFEIVQLIMILFLPFLLMWTLGGFTNGSFVFIWSFYSPVAAAMYCEFSNAKRRLFYMLIVLILISVIIDSTLVENINNTIPELIIDIFLFLNIGAGLGGVYFLITYFTDNIRRISMELKRDRESLYNLTHDLQSANEELETLANCDVVTDLPNRLSFISLVTNLLKKAKKENKKVAILFLDLDGFKAVNDTHGHEAGDMILKIVGSRISSVIRDTDIVARIGGDEFAISLDGITDIKDVEKVTKTIIKVVNELCHYNENPCQVGVSIGISIYPEHGEDIEELMKKADEAMYGVKKTGKNNYAIFS